MGRAYARRRRAAFGRSCEGRVAAGAWLHSKGVEARASETRPSRACIPTHRSVRGRDSARAGAYRVLLLRPPTRPARERRSLCVRSSCAKSRRDLRRSRGRGVGQSLGPHHDPTSVACRRSSRETAIVRTADALGATSKWPCIRVYTFMDSQCRAPVATPPSWSTPGRESGAADLDGAGQPVQCRLGARFETDDEVVDSEPFVRVDARGPACRPSPRTTRLRSVRASHSQSMPTVRRSVAGSRLSACSAACMLASRCPNRLSGSPNQAVFQASA